MPYKILNNFCFYILQANEINNQDINDNII
jgi:hypothetical protein